jgi:imidazolonepropionase
VGPTADLPRKYRKLKKTDLKNKQAVVPGLIDCHTHLVFAGNRADEFAARCAGATYAEIAAKGGGISATVVATREASQEELLRLAKARVEEAIGYGVRTIEIKSGYGLSFESELKCLRVIKDLAKAFPQITFRSTFLGAHAFPKDKSRAEYIEELLSRLLPEIVKRKLADTCDVFVDEGYFTPEEGRLILERARELGLKLKVHADELSNTESASLAAEMEALSADHLLMVSDYGISSLASSETVAVLLPGTAFYLKADQARARKMISSGVCVALATDFNPGTCMTLSLPAIMTIAALYLQMSRAEIFAAVTFNAAKSLGLSERKGTIEPGKDADLTVLPFAKFEETYYRFAWSPPV